MARKSLTGQLNMFDFFKNLEDSPMGEVQMVSLMPEDFSEEPESSAESVEISKSEVVLKPKTNPAPKKPRKPKKSEPVQLDISNDRPVMSRQYEIDGKQIEIAYINYNKVRILKNGEAPEVWEFSSSKEAVDYYVQKMQELEPEE